MTTTPTWDARYRMLGHGETIVVDDEADAARDGYRDPPEWVAAPAHMIGRQASDPKMPAHTRYRRRIRTELGAGGGGP